MLHKAECLDVSANDLEVIEAALHTQSKILDMQASAGTGNARERLNEVKRILAKLARTRPAQRPARRSGLLGWFGKARLFG